MKKLIRITTVPISLEKLLEGQLSYMQDYFEVTAISADEATLTILGKENGYATHHIPMTRQITPWADFKALVKLYRYLKKEQPQIVHTHTPKAGIVGMLAAKLAGVPIRLHTVAGLPLMEAIGKKRWLLNKVEKFTYTCATKVYPNSKGLYDFIVASGFTTVDKLAVIADGSSNGIDTQHFNPTLFTSSENKALRARLAIAATDFVFIFVGRLVGDKGINELVAAFKHLRSTSVSRDCKLLLVGPFEHELDPLSPETLNTIENTDAIISVGYQQDVRPYFAISDALVFPSYREGFPNVVMQAGAMGLPAIVSDINGCNEIIRPNVNGLIVPSKDSDALQDAMLQFINDEVLFGSLTKQSRQLIVSRYEQQKVWEALLEMYQGLITH